MSAIGGDETLIVDRGVETELPRLVGFAGGRVAAHVARSPSKPEGGCEDALAVLPVGEHSGVLVIADGLGGHALGGEAASIVVRTLARFVDRLGDDPDQLRTALLEAADAAHAEVQALGAGAGATLAAVVVTPRGVGPLHAGDSSVLVVGQRGRVRLQTLAHSPTGYAIEAGWIEEHEALEHDERHLISNFIGCEGMHLQLGEVRPIAARDTLLVASDGLFDNFSTDELIERIRKGPLERIARALSLEARERMLAAGGHQDDLSFLIHRRG